MVYEVDSQDTQPIYQQLAKKIYRDIQKGALPKGSKLPTVRELSEELSLARGTIKRAYDELERMGAIQMTQGRGSYVCYQEDDGNSRKMKAMHAIDRMLNELEHLGFSPMEVSIFLELKQRERAEMVHHHPLALVSDCEETLHQISRQLGHLTGVELYTYSVKAFAAVSERCNDENWLVITDDFLYDVVCRMAGGENRVLRVAYEPTVETIRGLARIPAESRVGVVSADADFGASMMVSCRKIVDRVRARIQYLGEPERTKAFLEQQDVVVLPIEYEALCTEEELALLKAWQSTHRVVLYGTCMDRGSMMYLEERIQRVQNGQ